MGIVTGTHLNSIELNSKSLMSLRLQRALKSLQHKASTQKVAMMIITFHIKKLLYFHFENRNMPSYFHHYAFLICFTSLRSNSHHSWNKCPAQSNSVTWPGTKDSLWSHHGAFAAAQAPQLVLYVHAASKPSQQHRERYHQSHFTEEEIKACTPLFGQGCPWPGVEPGFKPTFMLPKPVLCRIWGKISTWGKKKSSSKEAT